MASAPEASARVACREGVAAVAAAALLAAARAVDRRTVMVFGVCERASIEQMADSTRLTRL